MEYKIYGIKYKKTLAYKDHEPQNAGGWDSA